MYCEQEADKISLSLSKSAGKVEDVSGLESESKSFEFLNSDLVS
jgi:hypothetical protein